MKEINLSAILSAKRREKKITQDELAAYMGVSKASVSKWETGQSYPDITFLPQLAAYFNISIDELMGYEPQMTRDDIRKLYHQLAADFASKPFETVYDACQETIRKYYSCFPLLLQMGVLLGNHYMLAPDQGMQAEILTQAADLCARVRAGSDDVWCAKDAALIEAQFRLMLGHPEETLELLGDSPRPISQKTEILARAFQITGEQDKAIEALQVSTYQHVLILVASSAQLLPLYQNQPEKAAEIMHRISGIARLYHLDSLHPNTMAVAYLTGAQIYSSYGDFDQALKLLHSYAALVPHFFPLTLHGDDYFDAIDAWFAEFGLGSEPPRNEKLVKQSILSAVTENPAFAPLADLPEYKQIVSNIQSSLGGN